MKINAVIGNPPYNNDMYIPFVEMGHQLATDCSLFITPAKWQAKGGEKNETFRKNIVPHMSKIVYYPDCTDIFVIQEADGICYYLINKDININKEFSSYCKLNSRLSSSTETRPIEESICNVYNNIIKKVTTVNFSQFKPESFSENKFMVYSNDSIAIGGKAHKDMGGERYTYLLSNQGNLMCISKSEIVSKGNEPIVKNSVMTFSSDDEEKCKSFIKWTELRFTRFLFLCGLISRNSVGKDIAWRFVPDPGAFDHIFTDEELYKKYNLTEEEINIIESVIKERK